MSCIICEILGKNPKMVERVLGPAEGVEIISSCKPADTMKAYYCQGDLEIIYIENVVDWIWVTNKENGIIQDFIDCFNLYGLKPHFTFDSEAAFVATLTYSHVVGLREITIYLTALNQLKALSIKAFTK